MSLTISRRILDKSSQNIESLQSQLDKYVSFFNLRFSKALFLLSGIDILALTAEIFCIPFGEICNYH